MTRDIAGTWTRMILMGALALVPAGLGAQDQGTITPSGHSNLLTANPFLILAEWFNVEYERRVTPTLTLGAQGARADYEDAKYTRVAALMRYYPQGAALSGFFFGGSFGGAEVVEDEAVNVMGLGLELGYTWLLGERRNFAVSLGGGLTRYFGGDLEDEKAFLPTLRLVNIGFAF